MGLNIWQTERIRLRGVEPDDWKTFLDWDLDTETARLCYFIPFPQSSASAQRLAQETALKRGEDETYTWMIENVEGFTVGNLNTHEVSRRNGTFSYGVALRRGAWAARYASAGTPPGLRLLLAAVGFHSSNAGTYSFNEASIRLHEKLGFTREGVQRRSIFTRGQYYDNILFGITAEEFHARWSA